MRPPSIDELDELSFMEAKFSGGGRVIGEGEGIGGIDRQGKETDGGGGCDGSRWLSGVVAA
ncbi:unnamed protein product [Prunus armeniaca]|uniref:Uncharacterized protein n=1 Tax=Prunus armeniaca TaxID=36596 RepID=A0A6J5W8G0_PRUAR|nr:unnamed protein product [Prunus armeniaca]